MSDYDARGPWRVGGTALLAEEVTDRHSVKARFGDWIELATGQDIWGADDAPVFHLADWYDSESLALVASAPTLAADLATTRQDAERARAEVERVKGLIDRDRTGLAAALVEVKKRAAGGQWISEGRGPYRYDEADYRKETGWLVADIIRIAEDALRASGNLANEAFQPTPGPVPGDAQEQPAPSASACGRKVDIDTPGIQWWRNGREFCSGACFDAGCHVQPGTGPVPGRGLDPLTVEACAKLVEDESTGLLAPAAIVRIARRIRSLTSPTDTKGRPNGK